MERRHPAGNCNHIMERRHPAGNCTTSWSAGILPAVGVRMDQAVWDLKCRIKSGPPVGVAESNDRGMFSLEKLTVYDRALAARSVRDFSGFKNLQTPMTKLLDTCPKVWSWNCKAEESSGAPIAAAAVRNRQVLAAHHSRRRPAAFNCAMHRALLSTAGQSFARKKNCLRHRCPQKVWGLGHPNLNVRVGAA
jgi:hypothetical protein